MKFQKILVLLAIALAITSCGRSSDDETSVDNQTAVSTGSSTPASPVVVPTPVPTPSPSATPTASNCPAYPSRAFYSYYKEGTGTGTVTTTSEVVADQKLRVSIIPEAAWGSGSSIKQYSKMAMTVSLLRNGVVIASKALPTQPTSGYKNGINVGTATDPATLDFSTYLYGTANYSIRISNVQHNYKCTMFCTPSQYSCGYSYNNCYYYNYLGYNFNYDYNSGNWYCCAGELLNQCQQLQCGVGALGGLTGANWAVSVRVETDSTTCINP